MSNRAPDTDGNYTDAAHLSDKYDELIKLVDIPINFNLVCLDYVQYKVTFFR